MLSKNTEDGTPNNGQTHVRPQSIQEIHPDGVHLGVRSLSAGHTQASSINLQISVDVLGRIGMKLRFCRKRILCIGEFVDESSSHHSDPWAYTQPCASIIVRTKKIMRNTPISIEVNHALGFSIEVSRCSYCQFRM